MLPRPKRQKSCSGGQACRCSWRSTWRYVASGQSCVLIVNQLDALCEIVDTKTKRLNLLIRVVRQAATVRVVLSCREFEIGHDAWFKPALTRSRSTCSFRPGKRSSCAACQAPE